ALDAATGDASFSWNPDPDRQVYKLEKGGSMLYVAGDFTTIATLNRPLMAALDLNTGDATAWNPSQDGHVNAMIVQGNTVYVGWQLQARGRLGSLQSRGSRRVDDRRPLVGTARSRARDPRDPSESVPGRGANRIHVAARVERRASDLRRFRTRGG